MKLGCFEILREYLGFAETTKEVFVLLGRKWRKEDVIRLIAERYQGFLIEYPEVYGDIVFSGDHVGLYDGEGGLLHYKHKTRVVTPIGRIRVDTVVRVVGVDRCQ